QSSEIQQRLLALTSDDNLRVRYQLAFSLGELPPSPNRTAALVALAKRDVSDPYVRVALLSSLNEGAGRALSQLAADSSFIESKEGREMLASLAAQIGKQQRPEDISQTLQALAALAKADSPALPTIIQRLGVRSGTKLAEQVAAATGGKAETLMKS